MRIRRGERHRQAQTSRNSVSPTRRARGPAKRGHQTGPKGGGQRLHGQHHFARGCQRIMPHVQWHGARVPCMPAQEDVKALYARNGRHRRQRRVPVFQRGQLLDMRFEIGKYVLPPSPCLPHTAHIQRTEETKY